MIVPLIVATALVGTVLNRWRVRATTEAEYARRFTIGASGIAEGAESFTMDGSGDHAVLLLHGSGDTPQTLRFLAARLAEAGLTVSAPLLPGHGRSPRAFAQATSADYLTEGQRALDSLMQTHRNVSIVGLSMGGAIAARLAANADIRGLVMLAPYLVPPRNVRQLARAGAIWGLAAPYVAGRGEASVRDVDASRASRAYGTFSPQALRALVDTADQGLAVLPTLRMPVLVVNSDEDNRIPRECAEQALRAFHTAPEVHWVSGCGHVITIDYCKEAVAALVLRFLAKHAASAAR